MRSQNSMSARSAQARDQAVTEYDKKLAHSRAVNVDVRTFFTEAELDRIISDNEFFSGRVADLTKLQRYEKAAAAARWMEANSMETADIKIEGIPRSRPNAVVVLEHHQLASLQGQEAKVCAAITVLADNLFIAGGDGETVCFTFGVRGIWK